MPLDRGQLRAWSFSDEDRISDFEMKLMDIDSEHLGIPDTDYNAQVKMPSAEFQRICRDLSTLGDTGTPCCACPLGLVPTRYRLDRSETLTWHENSDDRGVEGRAQVHSVWRHWHGQHHCAAE